MLPGHVRSPVDAIAPYVPLRDRQCTIFGGIGHELMKHERYWLGCVGGENYIRALDHAIGRRTGRRLLSHQMS